MKDKFAKRLMLVYSHLRGYRVFAYLAIVGRVDAKDFMVIVTSIITYFFARKGGAIKIHKIPHKSSKGDYNP